MSDLDQSLWQPWIDEVCGAVGVEPSGVDVTAIHGLSSRIAADFVRPMAPVGAYLWGLARAVHPDQDPEVLRQRILDVVEEAAAEGA